MLLIPVELCFYAVKHKLIRPFQVYILLKLMCNGVVKLQHEDLHYIANTLGLKSIKAVRNNLKILILMNWTGYNKKTGYYFIRGFDRLREQHNFSTNRGAVFYSQDIKKFRAFVIGAITGNLISAQRKKRWEAERKSGRSLQASRLSSSFFPVANTALSNLLNISVSTAYLYKQQAFDEGYIKIEKSFTKLNLTLKQKANFQKSFPELAHKVRVRKNKLYLQNTDLLFSSVHIKRRRNRSI